ncbi:hypothetical protein EMIHUDRAFT_463352 [Emiliania huxleyi CCMP1516]|uniref:Equilibrative nucleoside transporter n=2 Tax=Emiliania huxleyi TaxID=2903 RepID=A0A0D3JSK7_EMIH1|nr:hypothetical protein EMIHUDRAFT_463352 [Emiliania huxleyi CCMP1516]EOD26492.1 hypothetical protein EMIHUDRAFT_463352 [Emiliania huxleyi CCMP1516]|eukprot:XP_005778921.1 hypothetical protein EMIHUDRAFT_463352 [Emiliania huxleyi CCMP1516]
MAETTTISSTVYWAMLSLGAANLLPWLSFLTLADYFLDIYGDNSMEFYFPAVSTTVLVGAATLNLLYGQALSFDVRVRVPTFVMAASLLAVPLVDLAMRAGLASRFGFAITLVSVLVNAFCSAVAQSSLYGLAALFGDGATQALQSGQGVMGVVSVLLRVVSNVVLAGRPSTSMFAFCSCGSALLAGSVAAYARAVWLESLSAFLVFVTCLACFPGLATSLTSPTLGSWFPLLMVAAYNCGDLFGKTLPARARLVSRRSLPAWVSAHLLFVPLFLLLLRAPAGRGGASDALPLGCTFGLGVSTGYIGCMALVLVGEHAGSAEEKELWGTASSFSLMLGLTAGSLLSFTLSAAFASPS